MAKTNGTRQLRLTDPDKIRAGVNQLIGRKINIIFSDNRSAFGVLREVKSNSLVVENMRLKRADYAIENIFEIYFDSITNA